MWQKPVFGEETHVESATATRATLRRERRRREVIFDPEFMVFGDCEDSVSLAGLRPWTEKLTSRGRSKIRPDAEVDFLGDLLCSLSRLAWADFGRADADGVARALPVLEGADVLLFCSHPIREDETEWRDVDRPYLTCYTFATADGSGLECRTPEGLLAAEVQQLILELETQAMCSADLPTPTGQDMESYRAYGEQVRDWLAVVTKFGAGSFLETPKYFVPVPVALFVVVKGLLRDALETLDGDAPS